VTVQGQQLAGNGVYDRRTWAGRVAAAEVEIASADDATAVVSAVAGHLLCAPIGK